MPPILPILKILGPVLRKYWYFPVILGLGGALLVSQRGWPLFGPKYELKETVISIKEINSIQELITAQYFGEVINSHQEALLESKLQDKREEFLLAQELEKKKARDRADSLRIADSLKAVQDSLELLAAQTAAATANANPIPSAPDITEVVQEWEIDPDEEVDLVFEVYEDVYEAIQEIESDEDFSKSKKKRKKRKKLFRDIYPELASNPQYREILSILNRQETRALQYISENNVNKFENSREYRQFVRNQATTRGLGKRQRPNRDLVFLGRGWVKAGFDLSKFDLQNCCTEQGDTLLIINTLTPKILNADINPWFIPERNVRGFDILYAEKEKSFDFEEVKRIKVGCKDKLVRDALERGILEEAVSAGEETLLAVLNVLGYTNLKEVKINVPPFLTEKSIVYLNYNTEQYGGVRIKDEFVEWKELEIIKERLEKDGMTDAELHFYESLLEKYEQQVAEGLVEAGKARQKF